MSHQNRPHLPFELLGKIKR